ncbi:hypothetical protein H0H92_005023 [Tricholoma furcatifolium]|nr:hypothetical protein H0H92_005023 [Tricholoma furcatifolium]
MVPTEEDYDSTARFLADLCPESVKAQVGIDLCSPDAFACLLYRNHDGHFLNGIGHGKEVKPTVLEGLWKECLSQARVQEDKPNLSELEKVPLILENLAPILIKLFNGMTARPLWTLKADSIKVMPYLKLLDLESLSKGTEPPVMLYHELGSFRNKPILNGRIQQLFHKVQNTFLVNASATGKTRLLYEGLCQYWGFYFTACVDDNEAGALHSTLHGISFSLSKDFVENLPKASGLSFEILLAKNQEIAARRFSAVLLAHLLIFRDFLVMAHAESTEMDENLLRRWLLTQLEAKVFGRDPFFQIFRAVELLPLSYLAEQLKEVMRAIRPLLPESVTTNGLFIVIDEANVTTKGIWSSGRARHSPLEDIIRVWSGHLTALKDVPITFIVAGVEIPSECLSPTSEEWLSWTYISDTGGFNDPGAMKEYLLSFIPSSLADSDSGNALLKRAWDWMQPNMWNKKEIRQ